MKDYTYYLPISSTTLSFYFGSACIKPSKLIDNKPEDKVQDKFEDYLLLTKRFGCKESDCCVEIVLTRQEIDELIDIKNGWFLCESILPITRVKSIFFIDKEQQNRTITNIQMSAAFVPNWIIGKISSFEDTTIKGLEAPDDCIKPDNNQVAELYDRMLGSLALMRVVKEDYMNFSERYIDTIASLNILIKREIELQGKVIDERYIGLFRETSNYATLIPYLKKVISDKDIEDMANKEMQTIKKNNNTIVIDIPALDKNTYIVAILGTYGVGGESRKKKIDELIINNFNSQDIKKEKAEGIALCYGYNRGYSAFSNAYGLKSDCKQNVKFTLDNQLDYYVIESVYQFVLNRETPAQFPYLDSWCPKAECGIPSKKKDIKMLDTIIIGKKKARVLSQEYWTSLLAKSNLGLFKNAIEEWCKTQLGPCLYEDIKEELEEDLYANIEDSSLEVATLKAKIVELEKELSHGSYIATNEKPMLQGETLNKAQESLSISERKKLVRDVLDLKEKSVTVLNNMLKERGISVSSKAKSNDKIELLIIEGPQAQNDLFSEKV